MKYSVCLQLINHKGISIIILRLLKSKKDRIFTGQLFVQYFFYFIKYCRWCSAAVSKSFQFILKIHAFHFHHLHFNFLKVANLPHISKTIHICLESRQRDEKERSLEKAKVSPKKNPANLAGFFKNL